MSRAQDSGPWNSDPAEVPVCHLLSLVCARQWGNLQLFPEPSKRALCPQRSAVQRALPMASHDRTEGQSGVSNPSVSQVREAGLWERQCLLSANAAELTQGQASYSLPGPV